MGSQLKTISGNGNTITYKCDDNGIRTQKTVNGVTTNYHLIGDKVAYESNGTDTIYYTYDSSDNIVSMNLNGVEYYYVKNGQGDIIGLLDRNGNQVVSYTYDFWSALKAIDGILKDVVGVKNPYRHRGYRYDTETGLYYLQSRYYNPEWGRFINANALLGNKGGRNDDNKSYKDLKNKNFYKSTPSINLSKPLKFGARVGVTYIAYRVIRMAPSLDPPLWWAIPTNVVTP
jgi:RHS repeat-associated protein